MLIASIIHENILAPEERNTYEGFQKHFAPPERGYCDRKLNSINIRLLRSAYAVQASHGI